MPTVLVMTAFDIYTTVQHASTFDSTAAEVVSQ